MRTQTVEADVVVVGGGLAGVGAAVAAARLGQQVVLINNRPVLGGNSSSEVRVWVCGATAHGNQRWARETGIIGEMYLENQFRNPEGNPIYWDDVVLDTVRREPNLQLFLNTDVREVQAHGPDEERTITSVTGWTMGSEILTTFTAPIFVDTTGDGLVALLAGARYRLGKEGREEFGESLAPAEPVREFLGSTLLFYTKDVGRPVKYVAPESAIDITTTPIPTARVINAGDSGARYWWIVWGGQLDIVDDNERIRDELRGVILGIWDYIKNSGKFDAQNLTLEWIGNVPGKREYRRFVGDYTLTQDDVLGQTSFADGVAFGGWSVDLHPAEGMYADSPGAVQRFSPGTFEIPYRSLYSVNVNNLLIAGRDFSATHIAFGAARVMATCCAMGQAAGTAAALCLEHGTSPRGIYAEHLDELRQRLLRWDAPLLGVANTDPEDLARSATVTASSTMTQVDATPGTHRPEPLTDDLAIVTPADPDLDWVEVLVSAAADTTLDVEVAIGDRPQNVVPQTVVASTAVEIEQTSEPVWVKVPLGLRLTDPAHALVILHANPDLTLYSTDEIPPGVLALRHKVDSDDQNVQIATDDLLIQWPTKPLRGRSLVFRSAPTTAFAPERATSGYNRPYGGPNMWASARGQAQWLRLDWDEPITATEVRLVFDDDVDLELNTLHHHRSPDEVLPQLVRDYTVEAQVDDRWITVATGRDNRHRMRVHELAQPVTTSAMRLRVEGTNGAAQARVVAFRVQR